MNGGVSSTIVLLFGAALVKLGLSDDLLLYVRPVARPWVLTAGIALVLLASWSLLSLLRSETDSPSDDPIDAATDVALDATPDVASDVDGPTDGSGHGHVHDGATRTAWLVLAPVVAVLIVAPPALGEFTANRAPMLNAAATGRTASLQAGTTPVQLHLLTFLLLAYAKPAALAGRPVTLVGFVQKREAGGFTLARLVITCCAADASTGAVTVQTATTIPPVGDWVQVTGTFAGMGSGTDPAPKLDGTTVTAIAAPKNPYD